MTSSITGYSVLFLAVLLVSSTGSAQEIKASLRSGIEYDDNVNRESENEDAGFLTRYFATLGTTAQPISDSRVLFNAKHGGKFFLQDEHANADTLVTQLSLAFQYQLIPELGLDATADMKDRTERVPLRDYNRGGVGLGLNLKHDAFQLRSGVAYRYFAFKPNPSAGTSNIEAKVNALWSASKTINFNAGYTFAQRFFETNRFIQNGNQIESDPNQVRRDNFHALFLQMRYSASFIASLSYALSLNTSNSFGQELVRHNLRASATLPLLWDFFATLKVELQRTTYQDPVLIDASFLVDEDNRNAVVASLARSIGERWEIELRYSLFLQEFGVGEDYNRQTLFLAGAFLFE